MILTGGRFFTGGVKRRSDEATEWGWFAPDALPEPLLPYARVWLVDAASDTGSGPVIR